MFNKSVFEFEIDLPESVAKAKLREKKKWIVQDLFFNRESHYSGEWAYDLYELTKEPQPFRRNELAPNASIKLNKSLENKTRVLVSIYFSDVVKLFWVFFQVILIALIIFLPKFNFGSLDFSNNYWMRIFIMFIVEGIIHFMIYIVFQFYKQKYEDLVRNFFSSITV